MDPHSRQHSLWNGVTTSEAQRTGAHPGGGERVAGNRGSGDGVVQASGLPTFNSNWKEEPVQTALIRHSMTFEARVFLCMTGVTSKGLPISS